MHNKPLLILAFIALSNIFNSCSSKKQNAEIIQSDERKYLTFSDKDIENVTPQLKLVADSSSLKYPSRILVLKDVIVLIDLEDGKHIKIRDKANGKLKSSLLPTGIKAGQSVAPWDIIRSTNGNGFFVFDLTINKLISYNYDSITKLDYKFSEEINLSLMEGLKNTVSVEQVSDSLFVACVMDGKSRLVYFNRKGVVRNIGSLPKEVSEFPKNVLGHAYRAEVSSGNGNVAMGSFFTDVIQGFGGNGDSLFSIHGPEQFWPIFQSAKRGDGEELSPTKNTKTAFISIDCDSDYIYLLYMGTLGTTKTIYCFDWKGKPIRKYTLELSVRKISLDKAYNRLYCLAFPSFETSESNPQIFYFDLVK